MNIGPLKRLPNEPFIDYCERRMLENYAIKQHLKGRIVKATSWPNRKEIRKAIKLAKGVQNVTK